jgi:hypothetical protein
VSAGPHSVLTCWPWGRGHHSVTAPKQLQFICTSHSSTTLGHAVLFCLLPLPYFTHSCGLDVTICLKCLTQDLSMLSHLDGSNSTSTLLYCNTLTLSAQWANKRHVTLMTSTPHERSESASNSLADGCSYSRAHHHRRRMPQIHPAHASCTRNPSRSFAHAAPTLERVPACSQIPTEYHHSNLKPVARATLLTPQPWVNSLDPTPLVPAGSG